MNAELDPRAVRAASALHLSAEDIDPYGRLHDLRRLERRRSRAQVVAAFALLVALVAAGMLARRYDPPAVGPLPSLTTARPAAPAGSGWPGSRPTWRSGPTRSGSGPPTRPSTASTPGPAR